VEGFDLPALRIPLQFFDGLAARTHRQVRQQLPVNRLPALGRVPFLGMDDGEQQLRSVFAFVVRRPDPQAAIANLHGGGEGPSALVAALDAVQALHRHLAHRFGNRMFSRSGQPIGAGADEKMRARLLDRKEQFVKVALPVPDMHTAAGIAEQRRRLAHILQPACALLLRDRDLGTVGPELAVRGAMERLAAPELDRRQPQRLAVPGRDQAGVHQHPTGWGLTGALVAVRRPMHQAVGLRVFAMVDKLCRIVQHQHRKLRAD